MTPQMSDAPSCRSWTASKLDVSDTTPKSQLAALFQKTSTRRQTKLVPRLVSLGSQRI
jgi:hypothetical protein